MHVVHMLAALSLGLGTVYAVSPLPHEQQGRCFVG
jgi:hypothetical protein